MKPFVLKLAAFFFLSLFFCQIPASAEQSKNGLFPDEIISADALMAKIKKSDLFLLLDARSKKSYDEKHIRGAKLPRTAEYYRQEELFAGGIIPAAPDGEAALREAMIGFQKEYPIVTYCNADCHASAVLTLRLKGIGFKNVQSMEEGIQAWEKKGYPVERSETHV